MSEIDEKVEKPQGLPSDRLSFPPERLKEILEAHRKWVESEGKEGERAKLYRANLTGAILTEAILTEATLTGADLTGANLTGAKLTGAILTEATLTWADLTGAFLSGADLTGADLGRANLSGADLLLANLQGADLRGAIYLTESQVKAALNWDLAFYSDDFLKELGLPLDHNERVKEKLAELDKEKKAKDPKR